MSENQQLKSPIVARALKDRWQHLAPAVQRHYGLQTRSDEEIVLEGVMSVHYPLPAILLLGMARLIGGLVLLREDNIPVQVKNSSDKGSDALCWHRIFNLPGGKRPVLFRSRMVYGGGDEITEYVGESPLFSIGVRMKTYEEAGDLCFESVGYTLKIGRFELPIPGHLLLGRASIVEKAINENAVSLAFTIDHPLFGQIYTYSGAFTLPSE